MASHQPNFEVHCSAAVAHSFKLAQELASRQGRGKKVLRAFEKIISRLETDPMSFGEPEYRLPAMKMQIRSGGVPPLVVHVGVCEDQPIVFIKKVTLMGQP